ncbi:fibrocystin-L-like [Ambystoma mexicanum]|uniref:fibrocystin-L-like n=1 Tax=Ambystoma mexicanum TaxID=8296 RepID=UPI0037E7FD6D
MSLAPFGVVSAAGVCFSVVALAAALPVKEITGVSPSEGSVEGGTILTVTGNFFDQTDSPALVLVGGQTCEILNITNSAITCRMPAKQNTFRTIFPGGRGLKLEAWDASNNRFDDAVRFNESTPGYQGATWLDMASYTWQRNYPQRCITRLSGFLIPPETDSYKLGLNAYYYWNYALYINKTGSTDDRNNASGIYGYPANLYQDVQLQKGEGYYFELYFEEYYYYYSGSYDVRLTSSKTTYTDQQTPEAVNEEQLLQISSTVVPEIQMITLENWTATINYTYEVQAITVTNPCVDLCQLPWYSLIYNGESTVPLSSEATEGEVQDALNALWSIKPDAVSVTRAYIDHVYMYNVTFISQRGE